MALKPGSEESPIGKKKWVSDTNSPGKGRKEGKGSSTFEKVLILPQKNAHSNDTLWYQRFRNRSLGR